MFLCLGQCPYDIQRKKLLTGFLPEIIEGSVGDIVKFHFRTEVSIALSVVYTPCHVWSITFSTHYIIHASLSRVTTEKKIECNIVSELTNLQ